MGSIIQWIDEHILFDRTFGAARSPKWPEVEKSYRAEHPTCEACGAKTSLLAPLNVHHVKPFHLNPELELDPENLITLDRVCHFLLGHLKNWSSYNVSVRLDAANLLDEITHRP